MPKVGQIKHYYITTALILTLYKNQQTFQLQNLEQKDLKLIPRKNICKLRIKLNPFPIKPLVFVCPQYKSFENTVGKGEIARNK